MNDPIHHDPSCPVIPAKLPSNIPKFEEKSGEDLQDYMATFHLWCSSNSLNDNLILLCLFQHTLIERDNKWYIELERGKYSTFSDLAIFFLNHFQLPIEYDVGTKLLANFEKDKTTHISDHIQEWRRRKRLIKATIPTEFLLEWFLKYLLPYMSKYVATSRVFLEEQAIFRVQQLEFIYSQLGMLYYIMLDAL
jgi:hypothetical protein